MSQTDITSIFGSLKGRDLNAVPESYESTPTVKEDEDFQEQLRIAERKQAEERDLQYRRSLQTARDTLSKVSSPIKRKQIESFYTIEQKKALLENHTVEKQYGIDGFKELTVGKVGDGDSGHFLDKDGNDYSIRINSGGSIQFDAGDIQKKVEQSTFKSRNQPEAVARAYGKSVQELTPEDYENYDIYCQNETVRKLASTTPYQSKRFDPTKIYQPLDATGLKVYARMEGRDRHGRYLATLINPNTGEDIGYDSGLDPNVNTAFSLFNSLDSRGNYQRAHEAQRAGEYFRSRIEPDNGYIDPNSAIKRWNTESGGITKDESLPISGLRQFGGSALNMLSNIGVAVTDTLGLPELKKLDSKLGFTKYADSEMSDILVGKTAARKQEYSNYMNTVSSKFESGDIAGGLWEFLKHPTQVGMFVAEQLGNMAPGLLATVATGGASLASFGAATAVDLLANVGMDFMEFKKKHGRSMSTEEMAAAYIRQLPGAVMDALSDKILVGNANILKTARYTPARATGRVVGEMGLEGGQEAVQNTGSLMNTDDKTFQEAIRDPSNISNFMLGALGGGLMSAPVGTGQVARHMVQSAAFQQFKEKYKADHDQQAADAGDTLASDHRQQRENFISSTLDSYQQAKDTGDSTAMFGSIASLKAKLNDTKSGLSAYDKEHIKATLYDVVNDTIASLVKDGAMDSATESVLNKLKDSLGIQDNEQLKRDLAKYAEVYGSSSEGRLATQNDTYENEHDRQVKAEQFETLIENLGGTKAEARKLLEEVAEENITSKTEGFDSYLAAAKKAKEEGDTYTFDGKVEDMSNRIESMAIKHGKLVNGLKDEMNKGAAVDSKGMLSNDKIHIKYGFDKDSAKRREEVSFDTSFKQEAFNYSTRGGIYRTADQISSEVQYMAEQLNSLEGVSQETKDKVNALVSQVKQNDDLLEHLGYELHRGIKGGAKFNAEQELDVELSKERHAEIKEAMESYFNQYVAPRSASEKLTSKEAYQLKKYTSGLSLSELKSFQKSLDPKKDSIAYEGVSAVIKNRERNIGIASSHDAWLKANRVNGKYNAAAVQQPQAQVQSQSKPQAKPQEKPSTARDLKITKGKIDKATDIDELIESGAYIDNLITVVSDPSHKDYKNKPLMRKLKSIKKAIAERIAKLEAQDASESLQNGSESTEIGQDEQSTTETQESSQNGSEGANSGSQTEVLNVWHATEENANLSNLALRPFDYEGRHYQSVEHAYQSLKSGSFDEAIYNDPRWSNAGTKIQGRKGTDKKTNLQLMRDLIRESFKQNDSAREELLATGNAKFTHKRPNGNNGIWETEFPKILDYVRTYFSNKFGDNAEVVSLRGNKYSKKSGWLNDKTYYVYGGRNGNSANKYDLGNPYEMKGRSREEAIDLCWSDEKWLEKVDAFINDMKAFKNNNPSLDKIVLGCWCAPNPCHLNIVAKRVQTEVFGSSDIDVNTVIEPEVDNSEELNAEEEILSVIDEYSSEPDKSMSSEEIKAILNDINLAIDYVQKYPDNAAIARHADELQDILNTYQELYDKVLKQEVEESTNETDDNIDDANEEELTFYDEYEDNVDRLKQELINDSSKKEKVDSSAFIDDVYPIGGSVIVNWFKGKLNAFSNRFISKAINVFKAKKPAMDIMGDGSAIPDNWQDLPIADVIWKAVDALKSTLVQYELTPTLAKENGAHYKHLNAIIENVLRKNPHLQLIYKPTVFTGGRNGTTGQNFANIDAVDINPNAAMAIYMAVSEFFANRSVKSMLNPVTRDEIAAAFGTTEDAVDPATLEVYSRISNAWGVFRGPLKNTLGKMVLDNLGIGKGRNLSEELSSTYANAEAAMGDIALVMAEYFGWITINDVYKGEKPVRSDFKEGDKGTKEYQDELDRYNRMAKTSDLGITDEEAQKLGLGSHKVLHFYKYNDTTDTVNSINETWLDSLKQFKTGEDTLTRTPSLDSKNTHVSAGRRKQEKFKLTKKRVQVLKKESEAPYYINMPVMRQMLKACGSIEKFRRNVLERMGYDFRGDNKKLLETLSYDEQQKIKGKNESLARELDYLISYAKLQEALEADGSFKGYFFSYFGSANGRSFIDSNTVNPQTAKTFTRFLMQPKTTEQAYDLGNAEDIQCELFAVAQAFNCLKSFYKSGDNKSHSGVSLAGKLLGLDVIGDYNAVAERLSELKKMQKDLVLNNAKKNKDIYNDTLGWNGDVENFGQACVAIDHCIRRLEAILDNNGIAEGASVASYLAVENDSTTSGYVIKFLLMPLDRDLLAQYGLKVGFLNQKLLAQNPDLSPEFRERLKEYTSIDELKADPEFLDIYKTAAIEMVNEVNEIKAQAGSTPEALGTYVYNDMCLVKDSDGMPTNKLNRLGKKLENSGLSSKDIGNGVAKADNGIPKPDPEKGVSGVLRNLMKPIVMIFGYNASKNSLVKRFSKAVMDDHIAYFMALINGSGLSISRDSISVNEKGYSIVDKIDKASLNSVISFMEDIAVKVAGTSDRIKAIKVFQHLLRTKSPYGIRFAPKEGFDENSTLSIAEWYELTVGGVYGKAVTNFLDKKFGEYGLANKLINDVSKMAFKIYDTIRTGLIEKELWLLVNNNENVTPEIEARRAAIRSKYKIPDGMPIDYTRLNITDLKVKEVEAIENKLFNLIPSFPMPEGDGHDTNIRSVETTSRNLDNSGANTQLWKKGPDGKRIVGQTMRSNGTTMIKGDNLNSFGDLKDFKAGERMLAVLLIHFVDGVVAEHTMDHLLSDNPELNRFLTVVHDAFIVSAKDSKNVGIGFNKALMDVCKNFKVFESLLGALNNLDRAAQKLAVDEELVRRNETLLSKKDIGQIAYLAVKLKDYHRKSEALKDELFTSDSNDSNSKTILANLGGDAGAEYLVSGKVAAPVSNAEMSTPTAEERASIQEGDVLGSRAAAWKDGYTIERIERDANATAEGRDRLVDSLNEYDELKGPVKNTSEFVEHVKSFLSLLNPERLRELSLELAKSKKDTSIKGVYFTGQGQSGNRRITVIKAKDIANEADRQRRLASRQVSAVSVYGHEVIHAAVSEPLANAEIYGVTRERSALQKFQNAVADKLHELHGEHPENFFRPDNYDSLTDAEKALADQSALEFYNYMFANPDPDAMGGLQEFIAYATTDPRMIELLKSMDASQYSAEYKGKNLFEKLCYIVKHIIKAAFGNLESRQKVINTYTSLGNNPKKAANMHEAIEELLVKLSYANKDAASKLGNGKLSQFEHMFEALNSAAQLVKPVNDYLSNKIKWVFDLGGVANRFERTYKSFEQIIREHGITENSGKMDTLKTLLLCPFSHNMRVALIDTLIGCCEQGQRSTFAHLIRDVSDKDDATAKIEALSAKQNNIDQTSRNTGAATSAYIQQQFGGKLTDAEAVAGTKIGLGCDLQCLFFNGYSIADIKKLAAGEGIEEAIAKHEDAIRQFYANDKDGKMKFTWTRNQCLGLAHFMNTNKGNPALCLNARNIAKGILCSKKNAEVNEDLVNHIDCLATLHALANAEPEHRLALSTMKPEGLKAILQCHRNLIDSTRKGEYIEEAHVIKGWHASLIDDTRAYAVAPVDPDTIKAMENDGYALYEDKALPVDNMTDAVMGFYIKDANTPQHRQGAALQITSKRAIGQSLNSFMEANEHIIGDRKDYIRKQTKKAFAFKNRMQAKMESLTDLKYEDFDTRKLIGSYYTPVINPKGDVVDFRITMFNDFKDVAMHRNNNVCDVLSKMEAVNVVKRSAGTHNSRIVHFLVDDMEKNMDPDTHRLKHQYENFGEVALGSRDLRHKHDIKYVKLQLDPESEFVAPDIPAAILPSEMKMAMKKLEQKGDGLWVREDWLYQIFGTPETSLADFDVMQKENMRAVRNGIRVAENVIKGVATLAKVAIVFKKPAVIVGNCVSNYMFHLMNGHNPVTAAAMDTENLQLLTRYMQLQKEVNLLDLKKDIGEATDYEKAKLIRYRAEMENSPVHELVQEGLFSAIVEDNSKKDQDSIKFMIRKIKENPIMQKAIKTKFGDAVNMDTLLGQATGQIWMREGTPIYDFIYTMTQYSDFVSRLTDYRIGMANMRKNKAIADNPALASRYRELLIQQIRDDYINYDIPQSKLMNYVNAMGITFFTKYFFRIQRVIRRIATRRPLMTFAMFAGKAHFDLPDNIFNQAVTSKDYSVIPRGPLENIEEAAKPQLFGIIEHPFDWLNVF